MSDLYLDEIEKLKYYRERITDRLLKQGVAADKERVAKQLATIDAKISLFSQSFIRSGSQFDTTRFNEQKQDIYRDLLILYKILYYLANERVEKTQAKIRYGLDDLRIQVKNFQHIVDSQTLSIYGNTIFRQANNFKQEYKDGQIIIDLGPITVPSGSYLAPIIIADEINLEDAVFIFTDENGYELRTAPYNYNKTYTKILGNYRIDTYSYDFADKSFGKELISIGKDLVPTDQYNLFLNKNKIKILDLKTNRTTYIRKTPEIYYRAIGPEEISFYVYGASIIQLPVMGTLEYANIKDNELISPAQRQKIVLRGKDFSFDIHTDGLVFSEKTEAIQHKNQLSVVHGYEDITDYMVEDISYGDDIKFSDVKIVVDNAAHPFFDIDYVIIKQAQISELEDRE